jgi:hypothetical protein
MEPKHRTAAVTGNLGPENVELNDPGVRHARLIIVMTPRGYSVSAFDVASNLLLFLSEVDCAAMPNPAEFMDNPTIFVDSGVFSDIVHECDGCRGDEHKKALAVAFLHEIFVAMFMEASKTMNLMEPEIASPVGVFDAPLPASVLNTELLDSQAAASALAAPAIFQAPASPSSN